MKETTSKRTEDYLRGILEIMERKGYARIKDIAKELGIQPPTAVGIMKKLDCKGWVVYEKYGGVTLTPRGEEIARAVRDRHETFVRFLEFFRMIASFLG